MHDSGKWNSDSEFLLDTDNYFTNGLHKDDAKFNAINRCGGSETSIIFLTRYNYHADSTLTYAPEHAPFWLSYLIGTALLGCTEPAPSHTSTNFT